MVPLLNMAVWAHAYCIDYDYDRPKTIDDIWKVINWKMVEQRLKAEMVKVSFA